MCDIFTDNQTATINCLVIVALINCNIHANCQYAEHATKGPLSERKEDNPELQ